jgi:hypothetical protein
MTFLLTCIIAFLPFTAWAEPSHTDSSDLLDSPVAVDPYPPSDAEYADDQADSDMQVSQYGNPYSPASATNFEVFTTSSSYGQNRLNRNTYEPDWLKEPFGRYGIPYSPDPMNQRYDVGNLYSSGSPMTRYSSGGRMERRW